MTNPKTPTLQKRLKGRPPEKANPSSAQHSAVIAFSPKTQSSGVKKAWATRQSSAETMSQVLDLG
jgi:hypothetical protein